MILTTHSDYAAARYVSAKSLEPRQQPTPLAFKKSLDFRQQWMIKHPFLSDFHSKFEHLYAGLSEGDSNVISYIPKPFSLLVRQERYTPDVYILRKNESPFVIEINPEGKMDDTKKDLLTSFFKTKGCQFLVVSNESILDREVEGVNWLEIVTRLHCTKHIDVVVMEYDLLDKLAQKEQLVGDIVDQGARENTFMHEIALYRLLHRGLISINLANERLSYDTEVSLCT